MKTKIIEKITMRCPICNEVTGERYSDGNGWGGSHACKGKPQQRSRLKGIINEVKK